MRYEEWKVLKRVDGNTKFTKGALIALGIMLLFGMMYCGTAHAVTTMTYTFCGTVDTWHSGGSGLTNNSRVLSSAVTVTCKPYLYAECMLNIAAPSGTVAANTNVVAWIINKTDGTNFEDGDASNEPATEPDMKFPLRNVNTAQIVATTVKLPPYDGFKVLIKNNATGVTINTAWNLKCVAFSPAM